MKTEPQPAEICGKPRQQASQLLSAARKAGDSHKAASALADLGVVHLQAGEYAEARRHFEDSLDLARQLGDIALEEDALANLGLVFLATNQPERAREILEQQVTRAGQKGDLYAEKLALDNLGAVHVKLEEFAKALATYQQALAIARQVGDRHHQADLLWIIAIQHAELGQPNLAAAVGQEAISLYEEFGAPDIGELVAGLKQFSQDPTSAEHGATLPGGNTHRSPTAPSGGYYYTGVDSRPNQASGSSLLWMAFAAAKSSAKFFGSGMKTVDAATHEKRVQTCASCHYHTGLRCKLCSCFTSIKAWLPHEKCPIGNWAG